MRRPALVVALLLLVASACTAGSSATTDRPTSGSTFAIADGRVTVEAATPAVTIDPIDPVTDLGFPADVELFGAYDFESSGYDGGATITIETGVGWGEQAALMLGLLRSENGEWELLHSAAVASVDGEVTIAFEVPHLSPLVVVGSPLGIDIDPRTLFASVGEQWDAYWEVIDRTATIPLDGPAVRGIVWDDGLDRSGVGVVRTIVDDAEIDVVARADGAVAVVPGDTEAGGYDYRPAQGFDLRRPTKVGTYTEVFFGHDTFTCVSPGSGAYGFRVDVATDDPEAVVGAGVADSIVLTRPADGVVLRYDIAAKATCAQHAYFPLARVIQGYLGLTGAQAESVIGSLVEDSGEGLLYPISGVDPGVYAASVDLWDHIGLRLDEAEQLRVDLNYNLSGFECGVTRASDHLNGLEITTVCPDDARPVDPGAMILVAATYMDAILGPGAQEHLIYGVVFDSNGNPENDWQPSDEFDWDFYQGGDRRYELHWKPGSQEWSLSVSSTLDSFEASAARAIVMADTIVWVVPADEFDAEFPAYRVISLAHDGSFAPEASGGDVSGTDPTQPLTTVLPLP